MTDDTSENELPKVYEPKEVEQKWYQEWLRQGYFHARLEGDRPAFAIVIPPPNVTGSLHMGHALDNTLQDILVRYKRMKGFNVCWMPGTDHAGIATQNVVERELKKEGKRRQDLGREEFIKRVWQWKEQHGSHIIHQLKRLGASCDWERERFTMVEGLSKAVREAFVTLHEQGLIYRDLYLINWCPRCHTALSDLEVEHRETGGNLWHIRYAIVPGGPLPAPLLTKERVDPPQAEPGEVIVATTRPETLLGDTAVAVHPDDERYRSLIGQKVILPFSQREIPIIADHRVDKEFGSGVVKVTPAHDFNDYAMGNDHKLPRINILTEDAKINEQGGKFQGLDRYEARKQMVAELEALGLLEKVEPHKMSVGECYRCKTVVEPYLSLQWFVKTKPLAEQALRAVRAGETRFYPEMWTRNFAQWMENIQDWCISRQIWWGHRIPAWYCRQEKTNPPFCPPIVSRETPKSCPTCGGTDLEQESDVLDTWFSSALWPFSTFGWPDQTPELKYFYPTSVLVTGFDIIFFWVARMMMMGLKFMGEVPFRHVHIHALVRDAQGQKMSKSKGNVIDPLTTMDQYGTDAFRFTLASLAVQGRDIKLSDQVIEGYRNFCNKVWNASRFALMNLKGHRSGGVLPTQGLSHFDKWIVTRLGEASAQVEAGINGYDFNQAAHIAYHFFWHEFCDWYLEYSKTSLNPEVLAYVLDQSLRMLHPFMPFITEEVWQKLQAASGKTIQLASYPEITERFPEESRQIDLLNQVIAEIRTVRGENLIPLKAEIAPIIFSEDPGVLKSLHVFQLELQRMVKASQIKFVNAKPSPKGMAHTVAGSIDVFIPLAGLIDFASEQKRLAKEIEKLIADIARVEVKLAKPDFANHAPAEVVQEERVRLTQFVQKKTKLEETLRNIE